MVRTLAPLQTPDPLSFVAGSRLASKPVSPGFSGFPLSTIAKTNTSKFQFDTESEGEESLCGMCHYREIPINCYFIFN